MNSNETKIYFAYLIFFILSIVFSTLINGLFLRFSIKIGGGQNGNKKIIRWTSTTKPSIGGFSFYIIFLFSFAAYTFIFLNNDVFFNRQLIGLILSSTVGFLIGLADDVYDTNPTLKFIGQTLCAVILIVSGVIINISDYYSINALFTIFWVVGIMNSINMLDNMDGVTATISGIILITCLFINIINGEFLSPLSFIIIGTIGALGGFMAFNFHPAKLYMGDTGSQFLGVLLSGIGILVLWNFRDVPGPAFQFRQFLFPILSFSIPIIDTTTVFYHRIMRKQSPFIGGRDHTAHHLYYLGFSDRKVLLILSCIAIVSSGFVCSLIYYNHLVRSEFILLFFFYFIALYFIMQVLYELGKKKKKKLEANQKNIEVA